MKAKRKTKCVCGGYFFKGDSFCHSCQRIYKMSKVIIRGGVVESVEDLPKGFFLQVIDYDGLQIGEGINKVIYKGPSK